MAQEFTTPVGRIVWGNPGKSQIRKDQNTKQPVIRDGKQVEQWAFGVAFNKAEFNQYILPYLQHEAASVFPQGTPGSFAWKFKDGDGIDDKGKPFNTREGWAGHYVLTVSSEAFAPPIYKLENGQYRQLQPHEIKCGDFVVMALTVKYNGQTSPKTPGLYINPKGINLVGYGSEIITSGADPDEMFKGQTYQLPPGASATPQAPQGGPAAPYATGPNPAPMPMAAPQYMAPAPQYAPAAPNPLPPPAHDFVANAGQPPYAAPAPSPYVAAAPAYPPQYAAPGYPPAMPGIPTGR